MTNDQLTVATLAIQRYAESHPRPVQVTQLQAADMLGISRATVSRMVRNGALKLNSCGMISIAEIDRALAPRVA